MRKTFPLEIADRHPDRVVEALKHELRKYVKRERRKLLPEGADYWDFDCRLGPDENAAEPLHLEELAGAIDRATREGWPAVFVEILAKPGQRTRKTPEAAPPADSPE